MALPWWNWRDQPHTQVDYSKLELKIVAFDKSGFGLTSLAKLVHTVRFIQVPKREASQWVSIFAYGSRVSIGSVEFSATQLSGDNCSHSPDSWEKEECEDEHTLFFLQMTATNSSWNSPEDLHSRQNSIIFIGLFLVCLPAGLILDAWGHLCSAVMFIGETSRMGEDMAGAIDLESSSVYEVSTEVPL